MVLFRGDRASFGRCSDYIWAGGETVGYESRQTIKTTQIKFPLPLSQYRKQKKREFYVNRLMDLYKFFIHFLPDLVNDVHKIKAPITTEITIKTTVNELIYSLISFKYFISIKCN